MHIYVYRITNLINNKEYTGVHTTSNPDDEYMGSGLAIMRAVKKHGVENFRKDILQFFDNEVDAYEYETLIVNEEYVAREDTYNMTIGGKKPPTRKGIKLDEETRARFKELSNTPERLKASAEGGRKGIQRVKENGWSQEAIAKRTQTRKLRNCYSQDMSYCHTPDALAKRSETRKTKGVKYNTVNANSPESRYQREKTKYLTLLQKISHHYRQPVTVDLLIKAKKERVTYVTIDTLLKYFTAEEIHQLPYCGQLAE